MTDGRTSQSACILVTGAAGFVGRHVVTCLLDKGHRIVALQRQRTLPQELRAPCERVLSGDICDPDIQKEALRDVQAVCHLSAYIPAHLNDLHEAARCYRVNAQATLEFATAASERGVRRFVHFSTGNMYAPSATPCVESDSLFPVDYCSKAPTISRAPSSPRT